MTRIQIWTLSELRVRVREQPRRRLGLFETGISVKIGEATVVGKNVDGVGLSSGSDRGRVVEGQHGNPLVAASEGIGGVDIAVASDAEGGSVGLAGDMSWSVLADLAYPDPGVAGGELVGGVDLGITADTQKGGVGAAEKSGRSRFTGVAELGRHPLPAFQFTNHLPPFLTTVVQ